MSFKRESNDISYINSLRQRRVRDLITDNIPEDEASLLSNGRFVCTVCYHRPVFDTVDMLAVHRKGKKHQSSMYQFEEEKEELRELIKKRRHEEFVRTGSSDIKIGESNIKLLHKAMPYDSRVKKKLKPYDRKPKLSLESSTEATSSSVLPGNRVQEVVQMQGDGKLVHPRQLKKIFENPKNDFHVQPYQRKSSTVTLPGNDQGLSSHLTDNNQMNGASVIRTTGNPQETQTGSGAALSSRVSSLCSMSSSLNAAVLPQTSKCNVSETPNTLLLEKKEIAKKYWQMAGSGWKKDWDGKWIRDEECEFDSDEEAPDLP